MIWYNIIKIRDEYYVIKTVETDTSIGTIAKFSGTKAECEKYCNDHKIKLGIKNRKIFKNLY